MPNTIEFPFSDDEASPTIPIAIIDLVQYRSEGELPYRPYSDALH